MTLIVSLRTSEGIVLAGDSLSTMLSEIEIEGDIKMTCPECGHQHTETTKVGTIGLPTSTLSFAQKVFPFMNNFGVGTFGIGQLHGKTMYFAIRELEQELKKKKSKVSTTTEAADLIGKRAHSLLKKELGDLRDAPDEKSALGFQVVGYNGEAPVTIIIQIGKQVRKKVESNLSCTYAGSGEVVTAIWNQYEKNPLDRPNWAAFSLQDAIVYAEFLINTTVEYQKFARSIPTVGGEIDVALVTPFDGFRWIRRKELNRIIDRRIE